MVVARKIAFKNKNSKRCFMIVDRKIPLPDLMKEDETIEFKKSLAELKAGLISIVAMLNKHGAAELWFGVCNDGKAVGLDAGEKTLRDLSQSIAAHIEPKIFPHVRIETIDRKNASELRSAEKIPPTLLMVARICVLQMKTVN